jgi:hypothetical protein
MGSTQIRNINPVLSIDDTTARCLKGVVFGDVVTVTQKSSIKTKERNR